MTITRGWLCHPLSNFQIFGGDMNKFFFYLLIIGLITLPVYGQKGDYNWCFDTVGISFNNPNLEPIPLFGTKVLWPWGGPIPSTISDCNGNLLFYCGPGEIIPQVYDYPDRKSVV